MTSKAILGFICTLQSNISNPIPVYGLLTISLISRLINSSMRFRLQQTSVTYRVIENLVIIA